LAPTASEIRQTSVDIHRMAIVIHQTSAGIHETGIDLALTDFGASGTGRVVTRTRICRRRGI
jgi:hypothetical protein